MQIGHLGTKFRATKCPCDEVSVIHILDRIDNRDEQKLRASKSALTGPLTAVFPLISAGVR